MSIKNATISNVKWSFIESISLKLVSFVLGIVLARLLEPSAFGILAVVNVFYLLTTLFIDAGLKEALIQKNDVTDLDYSSVFWLNIGKSSLIYLILFVAAPFIQSIYGFENLAFYIRLQSLTLIIEAFGLIQIVKATKDLKLKKITTARIPASLISLLVGISMAYFGYGIVSLIVQQLVNVFIYSLMLIINIKFKPQFVFDLKVVLPLYKFGVRLLGVNLLSRFYVQSLNLIYAKVFSPAILGLYTKTNSLQNTPIEIITSPFLKGLYPTLVSLQNNVVLLKRIVLPNIKVVTFLILVVNGVFYFQAHEIIKLLLGDKWLKMEVFLKIVAVGSLLIPMNGQCQSIFKVKNKVNLFLKIELISKALGLIIIFSCISLYDLATILRILVLITFLTSLINFYFTSLILKFSFLLELRSLIFLFLTHILVGIGIKILLDYVFPDLSALFSFLYFGFFYTITTTGLFYVFNKKELKLILKKV
ncbi:O-antigen/teichoic acid export membrane protein [Flavobacterium sp. 28A]|uniref:lipopolysaccharide biosynthesis protein n=1 Tax=Flavobacterium sp. 28A TaxID=2735895 RepID=UPI00156E973F|nr:lipopolysaccharide biosynthesis protein [Flavobacterium sp. 28A]NRT15106.1 O-antigen/teichoic acid export membrane protein [Flavobacterium sp. 28A]